MIIDLLELATAILVTLITLAILMITDWRTNIGLLAAQFLGVFFFIAQEWPLSLAVTVLFSGWIASAVLAMAIIGLPKTKPGHTQATEPVSEISPVFNVLASAIIFLLVLSFATQVNRWIPNLDARQGWLGLWLIGLSCLRLALKPDLVSTIISLFSLLSGLGILYSGLTNSALAAGLLAAIMLFVGLAGSYMILAPNMEGQA